MKRPLWVGLLILAIASLSASRAEPRRVLLLHSFAGERGPFAAFTTGFRNELSRLSRDPMEFVEVALESLRNGEPSDEFAVKALLSKSPDRPPDLFVPIGGLASAFAEKNRQSLFPAVPMILAAVDQRHLENATLTERDTAVTVVHDATLTIETIRRILPQTRTIFVVIGDSQLDRFWRDRLGREFQRFSDQLIFVWGNGLTFDETLKRCAALPPNSAILFALMPVDGAGSPQTEGAVLAQLHKTANAPIFGLQSTQFGRGIVGGPLMSMEELSRNTATAAVRILNGESPATVKIPPQLPGPSFFDWQELRRWNISETLLPMGSIVQFREPSLWQRYKWYILGGSLVCLVEGLLIWALLANLAQRRRAEQSLKESRNRLGAILETAAEGIITVDIQGVVESVNSAAEKMFGYTEAEMIGKNISVLIRVHAGEDAHGRRKDGSLFPIELERSEVVLEDRRTFTHFVRDVSERKQAEQMVREFGKQLLQAQEAERARLARELHDDITQRLARLALDAGRFEVAKDEAGAAASMNEVRDELVRLSEDVHSLAYRLHPALLERLGLANALKVECERFSRQESIRVNVKMQDVPTQIPQDVALCLFRVTQEGLHNVSRHARATTVEVSLRPSDGGLLLTVMDNGVGFQSGTEIQRPSLGLASMRERVRLLGGRLTVASEPDRGTSLVVWVPVNETTGRSRAQRA